MKAKTNSAEQKKGKIYPEEIECFVRVDCWLQAPVPLLSCWRPASYSEKKLKNDAQIADMKKQ